MSKSLIKSVEAALERHGQKFRKAEHCPGDLDLSINRSFEQAIAKKLAEISKSDLLDDALSGPQSSGSAPSIKPAPDAGAPKKSVSYDLLTDGASNAKTAKSGKHDEYMTAILHLAPSDVAGGKNMCPFATKGCRHACLNTSGRGGMLDKQSDLNYVQLARIRKTQEFQANPHSFLARLNGDIHKAKEHARANGKKAAIRLNGTSDVNWTAMKSPVLGGKNIFEAHPDVQFYDYTKNPHIARKSKSHPNYHVTFSYADGEENHKHAEQLLSEGHNVAVVFGGEKDGDAKMPKNFLGRNVVNGDDHDLRFLDPKGGHIVGLSAKAEAMHDDSGFVQWGHEGEPNSKPRPKPQEDRYTRVKTAIASGKDAQFHQTQAENRKKKKEGRQAKLAASEQGLTRGMTYNELKKAESKGET